jgi:DNA polymerase-3 subunit gamma/tau
VFAAVDQLAEAGHDPRRFAADLLERLRDLIILQQVPDAVAKGLLDAPADQLSRMSTQASKLGPAALSRCADIVHNGLVEMRGTTSPRLLLELICARMLLPGADDSSAALLHRLERMERRLGAAADAAGGEAPPPGPPPASAPPASAPPASAPPASAPPAAAAPPTPEATPAPPVEPPPALPAAAPPAAALPAAAPPAAAPPVAPGAIDAAAMRRVWDEIVATVGKRSKRAAAVVREASVREVDGDTIVLQFQHAVHAEMLAKAPKPVLDAVHAVLGGGWRLRCEAGDAAQSPRAAAAAPPPAPAPAAASPAPPDSRAESWPEPARPGGSAEAATGPGTGADQQRAELGDDEVDVDGDERTTPGSSEQQALDLLQETLGAEKIGDVAP